MATLNDVQKALRKGDKKRAAQLLQQTLKENPTAEAWYFAGTLAKDPAKSASYMQKALQLDPNHRKAKRALRAKQKETRATSKQAQQRGAFVGKFVLPLLVVIIFIGVGAYGFNVLMPTQSDEEFVVFEPVPIAAAVTSDALVSHLESVGTLEPADPAGSAVSVWTFSPATITDTATIYLYPSDDVMASDRALFAQQMFNNQTLVVYHSVAMLYPNNADPFTRQELEDALNTIPVAAAG